MFVSKTAYHETVKRAELAERELNIVRAEANMRVENTRLQCEEQLDVQRERIKYLEKLNERLLRNAGLDPLDLPIPAAEPEEEKATLNQPRTAQGRALQRARERQASEREEAERLRYQMQNNIAVQEQLNGNGKSPTDT